MIRIATVFSGIGAAEFALKRLGYEHEIVFACDNGDVCIDYDKDTEIATIRKMKSVKEKKEHIDSLYKSKTRRNNFVKESYLANYKCDESKFYRDVNLIDGNDYKGKVDLFVGGSPCQSFSQVGFKGGFQDKRGNLFFEFTRLVEEIKPKVFIYENVRRVFENKEIWKIMEEEFKKLGYEIEAKVINATECGIPQNRRRLFCIGIKKELNIKPVIKLPELKEEANGLTMQDFLIESTDYKGFTSNSEGKLTFSKKPGVIDSKYYLTPKVKAYVLKSGTKNWYQKPVTDLKIARTLLSTMGNHHRAGVDNYVTINGELRSLSERECHRLMGFTDDYKIVVSKGQAYKQAGNSIVVDVMMNLIKSIKETGAFEK